ncbi:MAG TPA: MotA/TolQ/ExbB proton channel family protein [Armatimonadota bacterium]|jgi:biopolymer transport protein ExbB
MQNQFFQFIQKGGPYIMVPLLICSVIAVAVIIERTIALFRASSDTGRLMEDVKDAVMSGNVKAAVELAENTQGPAAAVIANGLRNYKLDQSEIERTMEELALAEVPELSKRLAWLDTIVTLAPLLGLLGTVTGMIRAFHFVGGAGAKNITAVTGGVAEALYATATGLTVAVVSLVFYNLLTDKVREIVGTMELRATQLLNVISTMRSREETNRTVSR